MRRQEKAVTAQDDIEQIFRLGRNCQLAFSSEPAPYIVTMNYGYADGTLYFHSAKAGRKVDLARENKAVGFSVAIDSGPIEDENACDWSTEFQSIVGYGTIEFLDSADEKKHGLDVIMAQYSGDQFTYPDKMIAATAVFKLVINEMMAKTSPRCK